MRLEIYHIVSCSPSHAVVVKENDKFHDIIITKFNAKGFVLIFGRCLVGLVILLLLFYHGF